MVAGIKLIYFKA